MTTVYSIDAAEKYKKLDIFPEAPFDIRGLVTNIHALVCGRLDDKLDDYRYEEENFHASKQYLLYYKLLDGSELFGDFISEIVSMTTKDVNTGEEHNLVEDVYVSNTSILRQSNKFTIGSGDINSGVLIIIINSNIDKEDAAPVNQLKMIEDEHKEEPLNCRNAPIKINWRVNKNLLEEIEKEAIIRMRDSATFLCDYHYTPKMTILMEQNTLKIEITSFGDSLSALNLFCFKISCAVPDANKVFYECCLANFMWISLIEGKLVLRISMTRYQNVSNMKEIKVPDTSLLGASSSRYAQTSVNSVLQKSTSISNAVPVSSASVKRTWLVQASSSSSFPSNKKMRT